MRLLMGNVCGSRMLQMLWTRALLDRERMMLVAKNRRISFVFSAMKSFPAGSDDRRKTGHMMNAVVLRRPD